MYFELYWWRDLVYNIEWLMIDFLIKKIKSESRRSRYVKQKYTPIFKCTWYHFTKRGSI